MCIGHKPAVRLLTTRPTPKSPAIKSRGVAFLELTSSSELQACLKLHSSTVQGRKINVELTAGGGGKGQGRKEKIKERNARVGGQRVRRAEAQAEADGDGGDTDQNGPGAGGAGVDTGSGKGRNRPDQSHVRRETNDGAVGSKRKREQMVENGTQADGTKVRGGRRVKKKVNGEGDSGGSRSGPAHSSQARARDATGSQRTANRSGNGHGSGSGNGGYRPGGTGRKRFELTGANAVGVHRS